MKFTTVASLLLPASAVLANPLSIRQATRAEFVTTPDGFQREGNGCVNATVAYSPSKDVVTVSLPNNAVVNGQFSRCDISLIVKYPTGCTSGTAVGTTSGRLSLLPSVTATFDRNNYSVSPSFGSGGSLSQVIGRFTRVNGPATQDYSLTDSLTYRFSGVNNNNALVTFRTQGSGLQLQPSNTDNARASTFTNTQFVFDITRQAACC